MTLFIVLISLRIIDPLTIVAGLVPYFALQGNPRRSLLLALAAGSVAGLLVTIPRWSQPTPPDAGYVAFSAIAASIAACVWWAIFFWGRKLLNSPPDSTGDDQT